MSKSEVQSIRQDCSIYPPSHFSWIVKDKLAAMGWPRTVPNLRFLEKQGIKHLITLSPEMKPPVHEFPVIDWTEIYIEEFCPPTLLQMKRFVEVCKICEMKDQPVGVHCRMGRGRTGVMAACYLIHFCDQSPERAITNVRMMRPGSIETYEQERAVKEYYDYLRSL